MLEGQLKSWISFFLGQYVESQSVNVSSRLWKFSERLKIENLTLKKSIIPSWLPFRLKTGFIGQFEADLPLTAIFGSAPAKITFTDVLLILAPLQYDEAEEAEEIANLIEMKMLLLEQDLLDRWNGPSIPEYTVPHETEGYFGTDGWIGRTMTKLIDNLQIEIRNLHLRIEGFWSPSTQKPLSNCHHPFQQQNANIKYAIGISVGSMYAETTSRDWTTVGYNETQENKKTDENLEDQQEKSHLVFKLVQAINLSGYIDPNAIHFIHTSVHPRVLQSTLNRLKEMGDNSNRYDWWNTEETVHTHRFVFAPMSVALKLTMNTATVHSDTSDPRYDATFEVSKIVSAIDEEQLSVLYGVIDSYNRHDLWRNRMSDRQKVRERRVCSSSERLEKIAAEYLMCWKQILCMKKDNLDTIKKSDAWIQAVNIEQQAPLEVIISFRNRAGYEHEQIRDSASTNTVQYERWLHELGDALGVPLPEISIQFPEGKTGLILDLNDDREVVVVKCIEGSFASRKDALKPGLLLHKINGKKIEEAFHFVSGPQLLKKIDLIQEKKLITFRHPLAKAPTVTPSLLVANVLLTTDEFTIHLVRAEEKKTIASAIMDTFALGIKGYGPDLFSYHYYEASVVDFYIQNTCFDEHSYSCVASSIGLGSTPVTRRASKSTSTGKTSASYHHAMNASNRSLGFSLNYLDSTYPDAIADKVETYGIRWSFFFGCVVLVFEEAKMTKLLWEWNEFSTALSRNWEEIQMHGDLVHRMAATAPSPVMRGVNGTIPLAPPISTTSQASTAPTSSSTELIEFSITPHAGGSFPAVVPSPPPQLVLNESSASADAVNSRDNTVSDICSLPPAEQAPSRYSYDITIEHLQFFVNGSKSYQGQGFGFQNSRKESSYRVLLKQLAHHDDPSSTEAFPYVSDEWARHVHAIVLLQKHVRGYIVRRRALISRQQILDKSMGDKLGWLYKRDESLAFRRWNRFFCHLDEHGSFSIYTDGSGTKLIDRFHVRECTSIQLVTNFRGPFGSDPNRSNFFLEINLIGKNHLFCSEDMSDVDEWKEAILMKMQLCRTNGYSPKYTTADAVAGRGGQKISIGAAGFGFGTHHHQPTRNRKARTQALIREFSDVYKSASALHSHVNNWVTLSLREFTLLTHVHSDPKPEHSAFTLHVTARYLHINDHRKGVNNGLLHVGNEFLSMKAGKLVPVVVVTDKMHRNIYFDLNVGYRGAATPLGFFNLQNHTTRIDLDITGWFLPLRFLPFIWDIIETLDVLWLGPPAKLSESSTSSLPSTPASGTPSAQVEPWFKLPDISIQITAPMLEAYIEDVHCVAKLSLEKSTLQFRAHPKVEKFHLTLGPTALFVLTNEVALRLAQVEKFILKYSLRLNEPKKKPLCFRAMTIVIGQVKLEADRRLELLFALVEALTAPDAPTNPTSDDEGDDGDDDDYDVQAETRSDELLNFNGSGNFLGVGGMPSYDIKTLTGTTDRFPSERMRSMQFSNLESEMGGLSNPDSAFPLSRKSRSSYGRVSFAESTGSRSQVSTISTINPLRSRESAFSIEKRDILKPCTLYPLLTYQTYIAIVQEHELIPLTPGDHSTLQTKMKQKSLYRARLRIGKISDDISVTCESIICEVIKRSLSVVALDTYIPVMNFSLDDLKLRTSTRSEFTRDYKVDANIEVSAKYYNTSLADWEPFVEPWRAYGEIGCEPDELGTSVKFHAMKRLNINFTEALVKLLCSVMKNGSGEDFIHFAKSSTKTTSAIAADAEASKESGRVCVLNNLGVPIRLANLNTSHPGTLYVEVRDGWSYPEYARFHDVRVEVVLLPWWHPREVKQLENVHHKFSLAYGGAQSGVAPKLRVEVLSKCKKKKKFVFDQFTKQYIAVGEGGVAGDDQEDFHLDQVVEILSPTARSRAMSQTVKDPEQTTDWAPIGIVEINLAGGIMGALGYLGNKMSRWYRLHDARGNVTGEIFVALEFIRHHSASQTVSPVTSPRKGGQEVPAVNNGSYLLFDPLKVGSRQRSDSSVKPKNSNSKVGSKDHVVLAESLRGSYVPPLALEILVGPKTLSLLCPLRRAGKFLVQGDNVLAEVKVAQRDEFRRVLQLSSPVQLKNQTSIDMDVWTCLPNRKDGEANSDLLKGAIASTVTEGLKANSKISVPLDALVRDHKHSVVIKVAGCKPTIVADLASLVAGSYLLYMEPEDGLTYGYCFHVSVLSFMRKVYREEQQEVVIRNAKHSGEAQSYATKYHIILNSCLVFENTLPIRVQYRVTTQDNSTIEETVMRTGTLSPGEEVKLYEYDLNAQISLRLPEMDSAWTRPVRLTDCVFREKKEKGSNKISRQIIEASSTSTEKATRKDNVSSELPITNSSPSGRITASAAATATAAIAATNRNSEGLRKMDRAIEFYASPPHANVNLVFKDENAELKKFVARLDYTFADNGSPRVVLYASLWIYNQSHIPRLLCRENEHVNVVTAVPMFVSQRPIPQLMDCPSQMFEISTVFEQEVSVWSDPIHSTVVGAQEPVSLGPISKKSITRKKQIGIALQRPPGKFHRTTQVVISPRYIFLNHTGITFEVCQNRKGNGVVVDILPTLCDHDNAIPQAFDFDQISSSQRQLFIRGKYKAVNWSGPFSLDEEKEFPLKLDGTSDMWREMEIEDKNEDETKDDTIAVPCRRSKVNMYRIRIRIYMTGASIVMSLSKDSPPMYMIRNESSFDVLVNQLNCKNEAALIPSKEYTPFAWNKPDGARRVVCRVTLPGQQHRKIDISRIYDFASLDRDRAVDEMKFWLLGNKMIRVSAEILVEKSSRVLVFRDEHTEKPPQYVLEVKIIAMRRSPNVLLPEESHAKFTVFTQNQRAQTDPKPLRKNSNLYRFDADLVFTSETRPRDVTLRFFEYYFSPAERPSISSVEVGEENLNDCSHGHIDSLSALSPVSDGKESMLAEPFGLMQSPAGSPVNHSRGSYRLSQHRSPLASSKIQEKAMVVSNTASEPPEIAHGLKRYGGFYCHSSNESHSQIPFDFSDIDSVDHSIVTSKFPPDEQATGFVHIRLPKKAWAQAGRDRSHRSITWSYNTDGIRKAFGREMEGSFWDMVNHQGEVVGQVQLALKFRTAVKEDITPTADVFNLSIMIPSIGISFLHNANSNLVEVAYLSMQRAYLIYSQVSTCNEVVFSLGNLQMDNQMESEVVLGPKVHRVKEGVSVRLRDRWRSCLNYRHRGIIEQVDQMNLNVIQFRMLWNDSCTAGAVAHYELIQLIMQELEISTDEKFVVNLISVFQGLESLGSQQKFDEIVQTNISYADDKTGPITDGVYIEQLDIESIRIKFSLELNGGRFIKKLGPFGRRLAVYLPESNVKDFRLYFTKMLSHHIYASKAVIADNLIRHYQQQAVMLVLRGLHTVSVYANPFRIAYRLGHGILEVVRMPARGLASGSPIELVSGAYLGVRSLAMNSISAGYEIVAGASGILGAIIAPLVPESKRKAFEEDLVGFQRAVMEEVDNFDAAEERTMTKTIVRQPRVVDPLGVGVLTIYGPGSLPMEEQNRIDLKAAVLLQDWWRRHRLAQAMLHEAHRLKPDMIEPHSRYDCIIL